MARTTKSALSKIDAGRRKASGTARPLWLRASQAALVLLVCGDAALLYSCAVKGLDDDFLPIPITISVLMGCVLLPHLLGRYAKRMRAEGNPRGAIVAAVGMAALFVALVAAVTYFRLAGDISLFAGTQATDASSTDLAAIGSQVSSSDMGNQISITVLMSVMLVVTATCSFFCASWNDGQREADKRVLAFQELSDGMQGDLVELRRGVESVQNLRAADSAAFEAAKREARASFGAVKADVRIRLEQALASPSATSRLQGPVPEAQAMRAEAGSA